VSHFSLAVLLMIRTHHGRVKFRRYVLSPPTSFNQRRRFLWSGTPLACTQCLGEPKAPLYLLHAATVHIPLTNPGVRLRAASLI